MQKARRLACSRASLSSPSNTSLKLRGRSRTSSAGGDYVEASKSNLPADPFKSKFKLRKRNNKARLSSKIAKKAKKTAKASKCTRPTFGSLQNTVVLAPFHTLKKCFQTKLADLYLNEKIKKNNHKSKMAEKQNMFFEYDVMELKPLEEKNGKKERKGSKVKKGGVKIKDKEPKTSGKRNRREKSLSYCQCDRNNLNKNKEHKSNPVKNLSSRIQTKKPEKRSFQSSLASQRDFPVSGPEDSKRRRLDGPRMTNLSTGLEYKIMPDLLELNPTSYSEPRSETNLSNSNVSSRSKIDSWETISDTPSYRAFEGSLAISTTSFDSCFEQYERDSCNNSEQSGIRSKSSRSNSRYNTRLRAIKEKSGRDNHERDFIVNLGDDDSGQYMTKDKVNNSDGQLIDFMDREPQTQIIFPVEMSQRLQPLRRISKTQTRKTSNREIDSSKGYFLRSQTGSKELFKKAESEKLTYLGETLNDEDLERNGPLGTASVIQEEGDNVEVEENNAEPVHVSYEINSTVQNSLTKDMTNIQSQSDLSQPFSKLSSSNVDCFKETHSETTDEIKTCSSQKETNANLNLGNEPPCEILHKRKSDTTTDEQNDSVTNKSPEMDKTDSESEGRSGEVPRSLDDFGDQSLVDSLPVPETMNPFQEFSGVDRNVDNQPQDKEPSFIFGPRTTSDRLGESCEFSFGLNWVLSDDDNSEHGDHFL